MMRQFKMAKSFTSREDVSLDKYLSEIGKDDLLTAEEEVILVQRIRNGDVKALDKLTRANLRFVVSVAKQYQNQGLFLSDLINEGNIGLIKAAKRFDETRGFKFISYAVWWIRQAIMQAVSEQSRIVRLPLNRISQLSKLKKVFNLLQQKLGRDPFFDELVDENSELGDVDDIKTFFLTGPRHKSLDEPLIDSEGDMTHSDFLEVDKQYHPDFDFMKESVKQDIKRALTKLRPREADIIRRFFGIDGREEQTLDEICRNMDLTQERVRQIKKKAIRRLNYFNLRTNLLKKHL